MEPKEQAAQLPEKRGVYMFKDAVDQVIYVGKVRSLRNRDKNRKTPDDFSRLVVLLLASPEIVEDTNEVAIEIGGHQLAQLPRFVFGFGNNLRARGLPLREEFVYLSLALEIEPEKGRACVAMRLRKEGLVMNSLQFPREMPAIPPFSSSQSNVKPSVFT